MCRIVSVRDANTLAIPRTQSTCPQGRVASTHVKCCCLKVLQDPSSPVFLSPERGAQSSEKRCLDCLITSYHLNLCYLQVVTLKLFLVKSPGHWGNKSLGDDKEGKICRYFLLPRV